MNECDKYCTVTINSNVELSRGRDHTVDAQSGSSGSTSVRMSCIEDTYFGVPASDGLKVYLVEVNRH